MPWSGACIPFVSSELEFDKLESEPYITYNRLLDRQLCQFISLRKDDLDLTEEEKNIVSNIASMNIYSLTETTVKINKLTHCKAAVLEAEYDYTGFVILRTRTKCETSKATIVIDNNLEDDAAIQYSAGDLILCKKGLKLKPDTPQNILMFELKFCSKAEWINTSNFTVKPTR